MSYPAGAGPEAGRFTADPYVGGGTAGYPGGQLAVTAASTRPLVARLDAAPVGGTLRAQLAAPAALGLLVRRISVSASVTCAASVYVGQDTTGPWVTYTYSGDADEYDANQPIYVPPGESLIIVWVATTPTTAQARIEYEEI